MEIEAEAGFEAEVTTASLVGAKMRFTVRVLSRQSEKERPEEAQIARGAFDKDHRAIEAPNMECALPACEAAAYLIGGVWD